MSQTARGRSERIADAQSRLVNDIDCWVATASQAGLPYLIPLSFLWDGASIIVSTPEASVTSRNLLSGGRVRLGIGPTRDLVLIEGEARPIEAGELTLELGDAFAAKTGFDPRELTPPYTYFRIRPLRIQTWREANELDGREVMRDGDWLE